MNLIHAALSLALLEAARVLSGTVTWDQSALTANQGERLNASCTVTELGGLDVIRVELRTSQGIRLTVADSLDVKQPFSKLSLYSVVYSFREGIGRMTIFYKGIRGEDAGTLSCYSLSATAIRADLVIHVNVPVKEVYLVAIATADGSRRRLHGPAPITGALSATAASGSDAAVVLLRETEELGVVCVATVDGSLSPPSVNVTINGRDATRFFTAAQEAKTMETVEGLGTSYSELTLTHATMSPERDWNERELKCTAASVGFPPVSVSALIRVEYVPVMTCVGYEYYAALGRSMAISCEVSANPSARVTWLVEGKAFTQRHPITASENIKISERIIQSDQTELELRINAIGQEHYGLYALVAENDLGSSEVTIAVHPGASDNDPLMSMLEQFAAMQQQMAPGMQAQLSAESNGASTAMLRRSSSLHALTAFLLSAARTRLARGIF